MTSENKLPDATPQEESEALKKLIEVVTGLDPIQVELLTKMATVMLRKVEETIDPTSDFVTPRFSANFRNRLLIHHATNDSKLTKKAFEYAFLGASEADGKTGSITDSNTFSGADVTINNERFSLKTEAAKSISKKVIKISKFTEAKWIGQQNSLEDFAKETKTRISEHLENYDRMLVLRVHELSSQLLEYQIVEIPCDLLGRVSTLTAKDFSTKTKSGGSSAGVKNIDGRKVFTVTLDGSDEKITIGSLQISECTKHVSWNIPTVTPAPEDEEDSLDPSQPPPGD